MKTKLTKKTKLALLGLSYLVASPTFAEKKHDLSALNGRWFVKSCTLNDRGNPVRTIENGWVDDYECAEAHPDGIKECHLDINVDAANNSITFKNAPGELRAFVAVDQGEQKNTYPHQGEGADPDQTEDTSRARSFENAVVQENGTRETEHNFLEDLLFSRTARSRQSLKIDTNGIMHFEYHDENEHLDCDLSRSAK